MLNDKLAWLLEKQADRMTRDWVTMLKANANTASYHKLKDESLVQRIHEVYEKLSLWMEWEVSSRDLARYFMMIGEERKMQGISLPEVVYAVILARRNLCDHLFEEVITMNALDMQRLIEFNRRVIYFFDKAVYFVMMGYEHFQGEKEKEEGWLDGVLHAFSVGTNPRGEDR
ncbi:MAG: hypothetical protein H8E64_04550 [Candidatus Marinimicrobia bacterium]|nr:hypothetical protein [Candidatus Neomarinimicrobiota bacterium]